MAICLGLPALPSSAGDELIELGGGINLSRFSVDTDGKARDQGFRTAGAIQVGFQAPVGSDATLVSLGFETRGSKPEQDGEDPVFRLNYIQLNFQYKWMAGSAGSPTFYLAPGMGASLLVGAEVETGEGTDDIEKSTTGFELEPNIACGIQVPLNRNALFFEAGYGYGLMDIQDDPAPGLSLHNTAIKLRGGLLFAL